MKPLDASDFPELQRVFSGYLHEDFLAEYGTPAAALRAYQDDANNVETQRFRTEAQLFLDLTARRDFKEVRVTLARLGCRWTPPSRKALIAFFDAAHPNPGSPDR